MNDAYNDANTASPTYGIPGKRNGVIVNFSQLNDEQLAAMASNLSLAMGENGLACCQVYFSKPMRETRFPTIYEIDFLDAIVRRHHKTADTLRIGRTNTGHHHLSATREDFLQKLHALCPHLSAPLSLAEAAEVSSRYLDAIGVGCERIGNTASTAQAPIHSPLAHNVALLLLQPRNDTVSFEDAMRACMNDATIVGKLLRRGSISAEGIAMTFAKETQGIHVNLAQLGSSDPYCLLHDHVGAHWVAARCDAVSLLQSSFAAHGLNAIFFAFTTSSGKLTLEQGEHPNLALNLPLLLEIASIGHPEDFHLSETDERPAPFFESMYDALSLAMLGCANGNHRTALAPSVTYCFSKFDFSEETCGRNLESILGIYRAWIELCISDRATVTVSDAVNDPTWTMSLMPTPHIPDRRTREDSQVFLIPITVDGSGMPDFSAQRALCDTLTALSREGKILACRQADAQTLIEAEDPSVVRALWVESTESLPFACVSFKDDEYFFDMGEHIENE